MKFEVLPLQTSTVLIKGECDRLIFVPIFDRYWDGMLKDFGAVQPPNEDDDVNTIFAL